MTEPCQDCGVAHQSLDERAEEAAENAQCTRCGVIILQDTSSSGVVFGRIMVPLLRVTHTYQLCGKCGLALREFVFPALQSDPHFLEVKRRLLTEFWT